MIRSNANCALSRNATCDLTGRMFQRDSAFRWSTSICRSVLSIAVLIGLATELAREAYGAEAVVLGCTEIPLLVRPDDAPLPTLDSTRLLARAALRTALQED